MFFWMKIPGNVFWMKIPEMNFWMEFLAKESDHLHSSYQLNKNGLKHSKKMKTRP